MLFKVILLNSVDFTGNFIAGFFLFLLTMVLVYGIIFA